MAYWEKVALAKWDKCVEGSLAANLFFQETCQFQQHELDWSLICNKLDRGILGEVRSNLCVQQ